ncbi:hypothetical protein K239x_45970 [Planctomycetes bacterium K23_9]|uniref:Uncharacterized protein n=1 Tax=Stieleria marina TaxID=1930275 RepID=A0A517NZM7_9BACT|nr:hypothetical protein K239x_45970 [Planctomycetes bacterium K23_9]
MRVCSGGVWRFRGLLFDLAAIDWVWADWTQQNVVLSDFSNELPFPVCWQDKSLLKRGQLLSERREPSGASKTG